MLTFYKNYFISIFIGPSHPRLLSLPRLRLSGIRQVENLLYEMTGIRSSSDFFFLFWNTSIILTSQASQIQNSELQNALKSISLESHLGAQTVSDFEAFWIWEFWIWDA